ncbi:MAG: enoyl-CoA hydratase-related protein [Pseudomonadota bacterium]
MVRTEVENGIATVTLDAPANLNALSPSMLAALHESLAAVKRNSSVRVCIVTGAGSGFCSGADLSAGQADDADPSIRETVSREAMNNELNPLIRRLLDLPVPTIAAINGIAAGGGVGLALACDLVMASDNASFKLVFTPQLGLIPDLGASWHAPRKLGRARAIAAAFLGETISAKEAEESGLIWKAVAHQDLVTESTRVAAILANGPTAAYVAVRKAFDQAEVNTLGAQLDYEAAIQPQLIATDTFMEGVNAFKEKRKPNFIHR